MSIEDYGLDEEDIETIKNVVRVIDSWITDIYWTFKLTDEQKEIKIEITDIFGDKSFYSRIKFKEPSQIYKRRKGVNRNDFRTFCGSLLEKIISVEKDNKEIEILCNSSVFLNRLARRSPFAKINDYKKVFEKYSKELKLPPIDHIEELSPGDLNLLAINLVKLTNLRFSGGEDIRIDGLSVLSEFTVSEGGLLVPAFTPIETYFTTNGEIFREELKRYSL